MVICLKALEAAEKDHSTAIILLSLSAGKDGYVESDIKDAPDDLGKDTPFEAAGEFEVEFSHKEFQNSDPDGEALEEP